MHQPSQHTTLERITLADTALRQLNMAIEIFDAVGTIFVALNASGHIRLINKKGCETLGYAREELFGKSWFDRLVPEDIRAMARSRYAAFIEGQTGITPLLESPVLTRSGEKRDIVWHRTLLENETGTTVGILISGEDITEQKRMRDALEMSEKRFRQIFARAPVSIWEEDFSPVGDWLEGLKRQGITDLDAYLEAHPESLNHALSLVRLLDINDTTLDLFDAESKEELLRVWPTLFTDETYDVFAGELQAIWDGRNRVDYECSAQTMKGRPIQYLMHWVVPWQNGKMDLSHVIVAISDLTTQKRHEQVARETEERYRAIFDSMDEAVALHELIYDEQGVPIDFVVVDANPAYEANVGVRREEVIGKRISERFGAVSFIDRYAQVAATGEPVFFETYFEPLDKYFRISATSYREGTFVTVFSDITEEKQSQVRLRQYAERQKVLHDIGVAILGPRPLIDVVRVALPEVRRLVPCITSSITIFGRDFENAFVFAVDPNGDVNRSFKFSVADKIFGELETLQNGHVHIVPNIDDLPDRGVPVKKALKSIGVRSYINVPLISRNVLVGTLNLLFEDISSFTDEHMDIVRDVAPSLALAIHNGELHEADLIKQTQLRSLASEAALIEERERKCIATELHDHVIQSLAVAQLELELFEPTDGPEATEKIIREASKNISSAIDDLRSLIFEVGSPVLYQLGLVAAVEALCESFEEKHGLAIEVSSDQVPQALPEDILSTLYRAVRELLYNVIKHAGTKKARVVVKATGAGLHLEVQDDGTGFDTVQLNNDQRKNAGFGLLSIRERTLYLGGSMTLDSTPGKGTTVTIHMPLAPAELTEED